MAKEQIDPHFFGFRGDAVTVKRVRNGYVMTGGSTFGTSQIVCRDFAEVVEALWRSFHEVRIGEQCPWKAEP